MRRMNKIDLHSHPHFFDPVNGAKKRFAHVPNLLQIVNHYFTLPEIAVVAITACHPEKGREDRRWQEYMKEMGSLEPFYEIALNFREGWLKIRAKKEIEGNTPQEIVLVYGQQVRTSTERELADINVVCAPNIIEAEKPLAESVKEAKGQGGLVFLSNVGAVNGVGLQEAADLMESGLNIDGIEGFDASSSPNINTEREILTLAHNIKSIAVSNSHSYKEAARASIETSYDLIYQFSRDRLKHVIDYGKFELIKGYITKQERFMSRDVHILATTPGNLMRRFGFSLKQLVNPYKK